MKFFQRIEVWILLLLIAVAGLVVHFTSGPGEMPEDVFVANAEPSAGAPSAIRHITLERDHGNARLDVELRCTNKRPKPMQLVPPFSILRNAQGREIPAFFLPVEPPPTLPANTTADVKLRFWLEKADLEGSLNLELDGATLPLKSNSAYDLGQLENFKPTEVSGKPWLVGQK